jgi:hypothetical protein
MKKILMSAAMTAMLLASCTTETSRPNPNDDPTRGELAGKGYATITLDLSSAKTRALNDYNAKPIVQSANDSKIALKDLYLLVFKNDPSGALEYTAKLDGNADAGTITAGDVYTHTMLLTAGDKKIYVLANLGSSASHVMSKLFKTGDRGTTATSIDWEDMEAGITHAEFLKIAFDAGTPEKHDAAKGGMPTFSTAPLSTQVESNVLGLPMSSSTVSSFTLTANVTKEEAQAIANGMKENGGTHAYNRFLIKLDYLGAKAQLVMDPANFSAESKAMATVTSTGATYTIKNLAKYTSLVTNVNTGATASVANTSQSFYHRYEYENDSPLSEFQTDFDQASNISQAIPTTVGTSFIYVPENTNATLRRGQSSFYAVKLSYKPKEIVHKVEFNKLVNSGVGSAAFNATDIKDYDNATLTDTKYYYYADGIEGVNNSQSGSAVKKTVYYFANLQALGDALWIKAHGDNTLPTSGYTPSAALDLVGTAGEDYEVFTGAISYYRLDIGIGSGDGADYGVVRGNAYTATVNDILGPGVPTEGDLFDNPGEPVKAVTYVNVTIKAAEWHTADQSGKLQ